MTSAAATNTRISYYRAEGNASTSAELRAMLNDEWWSGLHLSLSLGLPAWLHCISHFSVSLVLSLPSAFKSLSEIELRNPHNLALS